MSIEDVEPIFTRENIGSSFAELYEITAVLLRLIDLQERRLELIERHLAGMMAQDGSGAVDPEGDSEVPETPETESDGTPSQGSGMAMKIPDPVQDLEQAVKCPNCDEYQELEVVGDSLQADCNNCSYYFTVSI